MRYQCLIGLPPCSACCVFLVLSGLLVWQGHCQLGRHRSVVRCRPSFGAARTPGMPQDAHYDALPRAVLARHHRGKQHGIILGQETTEWMGSGVTGLCLSADPHRIALPPLLSFVCCLLGQKMDFLSSDDVNSAVPTPLSSSAPSPAGYRNWTSAHRNGAEHDWPSGNEEEPNASRSKTHLPKITCLSVAAFSAIARSHAGARHVALRDPNSRDHASFSCVCGAVHSRPHTGTS